MEKSINIPDGLGCTLHVVSQVAEVRVVFRLFVFLLLQITRQTLQRAGRLSVLVIDIRVRGWGFPRNSVRGYPTALSAYMTTCIVFVHSKRFPTPNRRSSEDSFHLLAHTHTHTRPTHISAGYMPCNLRRSIEIRTCSKGADCWMPNRRDDDDGKWMNGFINLQTFGVDDGSFHLWWDECPVRHHHSAIFSHTKCGNSIRLHRRGFPRDENEFIDFSLARRRSISNGWFITFWALSASYLKRCIRHTESKAVFEWIDVARNTME